MGRCVLLCSEKDQMLRDEARGAEQKAVMANTQLGVPCLAELRLPCISGRLVQPSLSHFHTQLHLSRGQAGVGGSSCGSRKSSLGPFP